MKRGLLALAALAALATITTAACGGGGTSPTPTPTRAPGATTPSSGGGVVKPGDPAGAAKVFEVKLTENPYSFAPKNFEMEQNKRYHFKLTSGSEFHTFTVTDLGVDVEVDPGKTVTFDYTPTKAGTFKLICVPHELQQMIGEVKVQ